MPLSTYYPTPYPGTILAGKLARLGVRLAAPAGYAPYPLRGPYAPVRARARLPAYPRTRTRPRARTRARSARYAYAYARPRARAPRAPAPGGYAT